MINNLFKTTFGKMIFVIIMIIFISSIISAIVIYSDKKDNNNDNGPISSYEKKQSTCTNDDCFTCKRDSECLECMHKCYNRFGSNNDITNLQLDNSVNCNIKCWNGEY